jgi:hypothetical protein
MPNQALGAITGVGCTVQPTNGMRYECWAMVDAVESVRFGNRILGSGDPWNWSEWTPDGTVHTKTVYNFQPGVTYEVVVDASLSSSRTVVLTSGPNLPAGLSSLRLVSGGTDPTPRSRYVLVDTGGCDDQHYLMIERRCTTQGSAQTVPGTSGGTVLALCNEYQQVLELSDASGTKPATADYTLGVDQADACDGAPSGVEGGWYRGYPMLDLGEY